MTGYCFWITGLPGAGKTTLARQLVTSLKGFVEQPVVLLDGDELREVLNSSGLHRTEDRRRLSYQYARLSRLLNQQNIHVVCSTVSMFDEVRAWNREYIEKYVEVFIDVKMEILIERDKNKLYSRAIQGELIDVLGVNAPYEAPIAPDIRICPEKNDSPEKSLEQLIKSLSDVIEEMKYEN